MTTVLLTARLAMNEFKVTDTSNDLHSTALSKEFPRPMF